jgi:hypothetical protein
MRCIHAGWHWLPVGRHAGAACTRPQGQGTVLAGFLQLIDRAGFRLQSIVGPGVSASFLDRLQTNAILPLAELNGDFLRLAFDPATPNRSCTNAGAAGKRRHQHVGVMLEQVSRFFARKPEFQR